ncbi:GNAT family N-acetyltransferase [Allostreptomyces psammosilenae]|uniref:GNAT superfamily N-acetyltransferase n=1 Tax=Allostreptomyces psammosilenae TaxID=1892865 RepID=A0A853A3K2_9ACTN|nr:GNAT family N-acetyltransferase [Allostreptomyces psammosilenae]NYI07454.1 GNAT superfamily N-acetyltransferase [Allostreptomyces psammosilenae]
MAELIVREWRDEDEPRLLALLTEALAGGPTGERTARFLRWKHRENPFGRSPGLVAETPDGRLAGVRLFMRWEFTDGPRTVRAVRAVDTATAAEFRGRGVFRRLTGELLERLAGDTELVFNTPNGNSLPGYLAMGWRPVGRLPVLVRPVRPGAFLRRAGSALAARRAPGWRGSTPGGAPGPVPPYPTAAPAARSPRPGPAGAALACAPPTASEVLDELEATDRAGWHGLLAERADAERAAPGVLRTPRTAGYLRWRYGDAPGLDYRALTARRGGRLVGVAFGRPRTRGGLAEFTLSEVLVRPGDRQAAAGLLRAAARVGCDHVATVAAPGGEVAAVATRCGYLAAPGTGLLLTARRLGAPAASAPGVPPRPASWGLALGDLEVF